MISPADWARMSWHARAKFLKTNKRPPQHATPTRQITVNVVDGFNEGLVHRCKECGAWMLDVCNTDHGRRYEC